MKKNKILLLFPDGVGIRNYLYSDVFKTVDEDLVLFHDFDDKTEKVIKDLTSISVAIKIPKYIESVEEKFLRELISLSRLRYNSRKTNNPSILVNWNKYHKTFSKRFFYKAIEFFAPFVSNYTAILSLEKMYQKAIRKNSFYEEIKTVLREQEPKSVFCSHQRGLKCATIFAAAKDLGITTTTVIYSWDNLPKARLALRADNYLVWSEYMKEEMSLYYPEIVPSQVHVTGTPQFEFYRDSDYIIEKETFYNRYNLDANKKIICYSGDDVKTSPDDPKYLEDIAEALIEKGLEKEYQILLRRCPVDFSGRFDTVIEKYSSTIKTAAPIWMSENAREWTTVYPSREDIILLVSTAYYSDIVVNVGSTMAFDFSMFNKPCAFINYDQKEKTVAEWSVKTIYQYQHFRSMPNNEAVIWLNTKEEVLDKVLMSPILYNEFAIKEWFNKVVGVQNASQNIASIFKKIR